MKYIKAFESLDIKKYIIATMPEWNGDVYLFRTLIYDEENYRCSSFFYVNEDDNIIKKESKQNYTINLLNILYQTDDIKIAKKKLIEIQSIYKNSYKYNL